ncbi:hypothetical protein [Leisingera sp. ANG-M7]|uniref:hypothetical protein n=1 Tax=Leisingera sp. ANG-M7 TaxID=1577902 RepID=UPI00058028CC|nr:hypothetical protein [Leisingera sp. ANG-M7]KIC39390.1 hypothetical protein RA26_01705 [Leisingera sp. ANG-M7]
MSIDTSTAAVEARCQHLDHVAHDRECPDAALMRALVAERDAASKRAYDLAYAIAGGEDAHGLLDSIAAEDLAVMIREERAVSQDQWDYAHAAGRKEALEEAKTAVREACIAPDGSYDMRTEGAIARAEAATVEVACEAIDAVQHQREEG